MKYVLLYWSRYGHNKKLVNSLSEMLKKKAAETQILITTETNPTSLPNADLYVFSAAAEKFNLQQDMRSFLKNLSGMNGKKIWDYEYPCDEKKPSWEDGKNPVEEGHSQGS